MKKYAKTHEWIELNGDIGLMGISDFAQKELSDVVYVELPEVGKKITKGEPFMVVESVKVASDIYAPVNGEITEVNSELDDSPEKVNESAETDAWFVKIKIDNPDDLTDLMDEEGYKKFISSEE